MHQQIIFDSNGNLVTTPENAGSYDYIVPSFPYIGHKIVDVDPWIKWGNTPQDTTTREQRENAKNKGISDKVNPFK